MGGLGSVFRTQDIGIGQISYQNGATVPLDIPRGLLLKRLTLRLSGTVTVAGANGTLTPSEAPLGCITRVELTADGRKPFVSAGARDLFRLTHYLLGKRPEIVPPSSGNIGTYAISATFVIAFEALRFAFPVDSYLDTRLYDGLQLKLSFGPGSTIITPGGGGTVTIDTGTVVDVVGEYTAVGFEYVKFNRLIISEEQAVVAVSNAFRQPIPRNGILAHTLLHTDIDSVVSDAIINNFTVRSDNTVYHKDHIRWATAQARNVLDYQLDSGGTGGLIPGYVLVDYSEDGMLSTCLDTTEVNTLDFLLDVANPAGTNKPVRFTHVYYEPVIR